jgi:hypothetical protein
MHDAGSTGGTRADKTAPFQLVGAVIMKDDQFDATEILLADILDAVPFDLWPK